MILINGNYPKSQLLLIIFSEKKNKRYNLLNGLLKINSKLSKKLIEEGLDSKNKIYFKLKQKNSKDLNNDSF